MKTPSILTTETDPRVVALRHRLDEFYSSTSEYRPFMKINSKPEYWAPVTRRVRVILGKKDACKVLEFGAGITGYAQSLGEIRDQVHFAAQDVTAQNEEQLKTLANDVIVGDVSEISDTFDVIFSTFVFEHVTNPKATLHRLLDLLEPGGSLFIACPKYVLPFYTPPSSRHYGLIRRLGISMYLAAVRFQSWLLRNPAFVIHIDPSVFHGPWFRDADAIHWPSVGDLKRCLPNGFRLRHVRIEGGEGLKGWFYRHFLLLSVEIRKEG